MCLHLLRRAVATGNGALALAALDAAIPPLVLLGLALALSFAVAALASVAGVSSAALAISKAGLFAFVAAVGLSWAKCGRDVLPVTAVAALAFRYVWAKIALYRSAFASRGAQVWVRADRTK